MSEASEAAKVDALYQEAITNLRQEVGRWQEKARELHLQLVAARNWFKDELVRMKMLNELGGPKEESVRQMLVILEGK